MQSNPPKIDPITMARKKKKKNECTTLHTSHDDDALQVHYIPNTFFTSTTNYN